MTTPPSEDLGPDTEVNLYAAPAADLGEPPAAPDAEELSDAEERRIALLAAELAVKTVGALHYLMAGFVLLQMVVTACRLATMPTQDFPFVLVFIINTITFSINVLLGQGLSRLMQWGRWLGIGLYSLALLILLLAEVQSVTRKGPGLVQVVFIAVCAAYTIGVLGLLIAPHSSGVFSADYREAVRLTPHLRPELGCRAAATMAVVACATVLMVLALSTLG